MSARWRRYARRIRWPNRTMGLRVTFEAIETQGVDGFLEQIRDELNQRNYVPLPARKQEIPKDGGKVRVLSIPAIRDQDAGAGERDHALRQVHLHRVRKICG